MASGSGLTQEEATQCLGVLPGHPVPGRYKYGDLALQVGGLSNLRQKDVGMCPAGIRPENDCAGETHKQL
jgi:hypothetical protein